MDSSRRSFLKTVGGGAITGLITPLDLFASDPELDLDPNLNDEKFWKQIRSQFPLSKEKIFLNNGTLGPSPGVVLDAVKKRMTEVEESMFYGGFETSCSKIASFVRVEASEIALTHNVTEGINIVCWGLPMKHGDEVIMTTHEHVGNALPWLNRSSLHGITIKTFAPAATASETLTRIAELITSKTRVIAVPHIPCTMGQVLPVKEISRLGREKGIYVFIDGAHGPGMLDMDLKDLGCDFYASCCHKWMLGPKGTAFLYVRKEMQEDLQAHYVGGGSDSGWDMLTEPPVLKGYAPSAHRYFYGTQNAALFAGVNASVDFLQKIGMKAIEERVKYLAKYFQDGLLKMGDRIEMLTPVEEASRAAVIGFKIKKLTSDKFQKITNEKQIIIRMVPENGLNSLRVSTHIYNSTKELDTLLNLIDIHS